MNPKNPRPQKKANYNQEMEDIISEIQSGCDFDNLNHHNSSSKKPTLLLHACCGPCSSAVLERLATVFDITIFYYNPNIHPQAEYERRLEELKKFLTEFPFSVENSVKLVVENYNVEDYFEATNVRNETELQTEAEKGERCRRCYEFRMKKSFEYACQNNFNYFTTTLSISPHKDSEKINTIGRELENGFLDYPFDFAQGKARNDKKTKFLPSDFKKKGGFLRSTQLSEEYGLWRQDYCGCVYSMNN